jgi:hypothetical protein
MILMGVAGLCLLGLLLLVRAPAPFPQASGKNRPMNVGVVKLDALATGRVLQQEALLRDPAPLFLPTEWNTAMYVRPEKSLLRPGDSLGSYKAKFVFGGGSLPVALPPPVSVPGKPAEALDELAADHPFIAFAHRDPLPAPLSQRGLLAEISSAAGGAVRVRSPLPALGLPDAGIWRPAEFMVQSTALGLLGRPCLVVSSGVEAVDVVLERRVVEGWQAFVRSGHLQPGLYRIVLGP